MTFFDAATRQTFENEKRALDVAHTLHLKKQDIFYVRKTKAKEKNEQDLTLQHLIDVHQVKQRRPRKEGGGARENSNSFKYHVLVGSKRLEVCFKAFLALHSITVKRVKRLRGLKGLGKSPVDLRGKRKKRPTVVILGSFYEIILRVFPKKLLNMRQSLTNIWMLV